MSHNNMRQLFISALIAPIVAPLATFAVVFVLSFLSSGMQGTSGWLGVLGMLLIVGAPVAYGTTWLLALPCLVFLLRREKFNLGAVCAIGMVAGIFGGEFISYGLRRPSSLHDIVGPGVVGLIEGLLVSVVLYALYKRLTRE